MSKVDELEELDEDDVEVETNVSFDLGWTCKNCGKDNIEYNIAPEETIECICEKCGKKYEYYYESY